MDKFIMKAKIRYKCDKWITGTCRDQSARFNAWCSNCVIQFLCEEYLKLDKKNDPILLSEKIGSFERRIEKLEYKLQTIKNIIEV